MNNEITTEMTTQDQVRTIMKDCENRLVETFGKPVTLIYRIRVNSISQAHLIQIVCGVCKVTFSDLLYRQERDYIVPRKLLCWLMSWYLGYSAGKLETIFKRDHSSVCKYIRDVNDMLETKDPLYLEPLKLIEQKILNITKEPA